MNTALEGLKFKGSTRGDGEISVTVSDGYASSSDKLFSIPNTAPILTVPTNNLTGKIGGSNPSLSGISLTDIDTIDNVDNATMTISMTSTSGKFVAQLPTLTDTGQTFDHDSDSTTAALTVNKFSDGDTIYISSEQLQTGTKLFLLTPKDTSDLTAGFDKSNLTISGMNSGALELQGGLSFISSALAALSLEGEESGTSTITVRARDFKADAISKSFRLILELVTPSAPSVSNNITSGVSQAELDRGEV